MKQINSYKFRIYPTKKQEEELFRTIGCARLVYNLSLDSLNNLYTDYKNGTITEKEYKKAKKELTASTFRGNKKYDFLKDVDSTALKYGYKHVKQSFNNFYEGRASKPKFKSKNKNKWSYTTCRASRTARNLRLEKGGWLILPKISDRVKIRLSKNPKGKLVSTTITKTRSGKWFASMQYEQNTQIPIHEKTISQIKNPVGIDMGIKDLVVTSTGVIFENFKYAYKSQKKIAKLDKSLSRKKEQAKKDGRKLEDCKNYQKCKLKRARAHEKVVNQREDMLHKVTTSLVNNHDFIAVEDLSAKNLMKNSNLAYAITDVSWGSLFVKLTYKAERAGVNVVTVDRFFPSTQLCSFCGEKSGPRGIKNLSVREWKCSSCGMLHDRDVNASINILNKGLEDFLTAGTVG